MRKAILLIFSFLCVTLMSEAKEGKIKYGKYIIYEGEIENKVPQGNGNLVITNINDKEKAYISINGTFNDTKITDVTLDASDFNALEFEGDMTFEPKGEKGKSMEITFNLQKGVLYHDDIEYLGRRLKHITVEDLMITVSASKEETEWSFTFGPNAMPNTKFKGLIEDIPLPHNLDMFGYTSQKMIGLSADFTINGVWISCTQEGKYIFTDGSYYCNNTMHFSNNDEVLLANNDWVGSMTYADGTHITKDDKDNFEIQFNKGSKYTGTLKRTSLQDLSLRTSDHPDFKYNTGILTTDGVSERWISGESFSARHQRLVKLMREKLVAEVENETMTEQEAISLEKKLKEKEDRLQALIMAKRLEFSDDTLSATNEMYPEILTGIKNKIFSGLVMKSDDNGKLFAKKIQLKLSVYFVTTTRCILSFNGKAIASDEETNEYFTSLSPTFIEEGNYAYRIEDGDICLYDATDYNRQPFTFRYANGILTCVEFSGQLKAKK